ncbi:MAG TPA: LuxR C-terminal-related transcriptional regulator [Anaerolineaceae bacterium]|nr:LuxR C-terminal-related transcriptional regulator [Anaerolineaceae bacterium]
MDIKSDLELKKHVGEEFQWELMADAPRDERMMTIEQSRNIESILLKTKITVPRISPEFVHRQRLTERIDRGVQGPLTIVSAPAGFGKTNLLVDWVKNTVLPVAWFSLDNDDNTLPRFSRYLVGALQSLAPHFRDEELDFLETIRGGGIELGVTLLVNGLTALTQEIVLVLDDFHVLEDRTVLQALNYFIKFLPQNLHLIIASRSAPALELAGLRGKGQLVELGMDDLRFTGEEVGRFFDEVMGLQLPIETIQVLEQRTDGWVTGLQMAAISLRHQLDPTALLTNQEGTTHYLAEFLAEEVLDKQPEEIRQFLLRSSILDTLTGPLCEAVVNPGAQPGFGTVMLNQLVHANLFITALDERYDWFRYHPLFADFLRHVQAEINPGEIPLLYKRAAEWFEQKGDLEKALQYALGSADMEWAAQLIERNILALIRTGEIFPLTDWIGKLPDAVIQVHPSLSLPYAWGLIAEYRLDLARYWLDDVRRRISELDRQTDDLSRAGQNETGSELEGFGLWNIRGGLAICESTLALFSGDLDQAAEFSREATSYLQEENPFVQSLIALDDSMYFVLSGDTEKASASLRETVQIARQANNLMVMIVASCQLAYEQVLQGRLSQAWKSLQKAQYMTMGSNGKPLPLAGLVEIGLGEIMLERGSLAEASTYLERGYQMSQNLWSMGSQEGLISLARLRQAQGDDTGSQAVISEAFRLSDSNESSQWDSKVVPALAVRLSLIRNDLAEAEQWWKKGEFPELTEKFHLEDYPYHIFEYLQLTQARYLLRKGQASGNTAFLQSASDLLEMLLTEATRFQRLTSQIEILILLAQAQAALVDDRAVNTLLKALALGEPEGYQQIYLDEGWYLSTLLSECQSAQQKGESYLPSPAFIERLLAALPHPVGEQPAAIQSAKAQEAKPTTAKLEDGLPISLSAREMEVLKLIAEGKSNQEISAQLYLALNTVKRHAYNIFAKLEVRKRTQAVSMARKLGLIP